MGTNWPSACSVVRQQENVSCAQQPPVLEVVYDGALALEGFQMRGPGWGSLSSTLCKTIFPSETVDGQGECPSYDCSDPVRPAPFSKGVVARTVEVPQIEWIDKACRGEGCKAIPPPASPQCTPMKAFWSNWVVIGVSKRVVGGR